MWVKAPRLPWSGVKSPPARAGAYQASFHELKSSPGLEIRKRNPPKGGGILDVQTRISADCGPALRFQDFPADLVPKQVGGRKHPLCLKVSQGLVHRTEDLGGRFGDERAGILLRLPHHIDILGVLKGMVQLSLHAA